MPETQTASRSGLYTREEAPVPLDGVSIEAEISSFCARVAVSQRYVNREATPIEAVYVFPLDEGAAVCGFEAVIDGTLVVGEVQDREKAFEMYDDAMESGHGAFLLDEERPDVFQASIGNLPPGKEVLVKLTYVTELSVEGQALRFSIPTTVSPRYAPAADRAGVGRPDSETLNPPVAWSVPYGLNLAIRLSMAGAITRVASPSHPTAVEVNGTVASVTLSQRDAALDRDFVLEVAAEGLDAPQAWIERGEDGAESVAIAFVPSLPDAAAPREVIFVVDRSGSMGGTSIEEVRNALQLCLRSMISGCRFNIIGFGSTFSALFPESRAYDETSLGEASAHVAALQADLGGTEILPALTFALERAPHGALARQVVVLTDGEVTNTDEVLALARLHAAAARIFTFGIGAGASHHLVKGLARAGGGTGEFIYPGERIEPKIVRQFGRLLSPALTSVRMDWGGLDVTPAPLEIPPVFAGGRLLLYGLLNRTPEGTPAVARLGADTPTGPARFEVPLDPARVASGRTVAVLAARARIRELEESAEWTGGRGSRQRERRASRVVQEIVALSMRYGLMSRETSYVAVERRETPVHGDVQLRRVPVALTTGWGGFERVTTGRMRLHAPMTLGAMPGQVLRAKLADAAFSERDQPVAYARARMDGLRRQLQTVTSRVEAFRDRAAARAKEDAAAPAPAGMHALVALHRADGTWHLTSELAKIIGHELEQLELALEGATGDPEDVRTAWATALALAWLRTHARHVEDEWRLLAAKGRTWLDNVTAVPPGRGAWVEAATAFLKAR